jgi:hypothetical protein
VSEVARVRVGRVLAGYAVAAALCGTGAYLTLGLAGQMLRDWTLHNALGGAAIGALVWVVVPRQPRNAAVWIMILTAVFQSTNALALGLGQWQLARLGLSSDISLLIPRELPLALALTLQVTAWIWIPAIFLLLTLGLLLFPDGRVPGPRWRPVAVAMAGVIGVVSLLFLWGARPSGKVAVYGGDAPFDQLPTVIVAAVSAGLPVLTLSVIASLVALVRRYRASTGVERQQFRWIGWGAAVLAGAMLLILPVFAASSIPMDLMRVATAAALPLFIVSYLVAIARYRLYEIDRLISRTVGYGLLTTLLVGVYAIGVVALGRIVQAVTGGGGHLVVAASTLVVAGLFQPLRRRVQALVDRRFNRARYDAQRTVKEFAQHLRGEVDIDALTDNLAAAAASTLRPAFAAVWLLSPGRGGS